jgi:hypothetical protein
MPAVARISKKKAAAVVEVVAAAVEVVAAPVVTVEEAPAPATAQAATANKKKAPKKPIKVIAVVTPDGIEGSFSTDSRRPLIAHLPIKTSEVQFHDQALRYDPNPPSQAEPEPYDAAGNDMFTAGQEILSAVAAATIAAAEEPVIRAPVVEVAPVSMPCFRKAELMVQYKGCSEEKRLPASTDIACFWCAHAFDSMPCIIPEREVGGVYMVYGNFCSPECGVAYLLTEGIDPHVRWERMALLHRIYDREGIGRIFPAPARESLKLFGGPMSVESFRATVRERKVRVDVHMPPMVSILGSIDTKPIDFFDTSLKQFGPNGAIVSPPQRSVEEGLRLKRNKPLKDKESTLDTVMNIKIGGRRV